MSLIPKYLNVILFLSIFISWSIGYEYGKSKEKDSIENKQKSFLIANQKSTINKMEKQAQSTQVLMDKLQETNSDLTQKYFHTQQDLQNAKKNINHLNVIRGNFLRYISTSSATAMSSASNSSNGINENTTSYRATDVGDKINDLIYRCNMMRNNYMALQSFYTNLYGTYNDK